jgi:DNA-directed RNA polymerase subunit beta'
MKENVICGNKIPAGTGLRDWQHVVVHNAEEYAAIQAARAAAAAEAQLRQEELNQF